MSFVFATPVRFADVDHAGIVYYPRYFHLFHLAFEELWRARGGAGAYRDLLERDRIGFPAVHAACDFRAPLRFGDIAEVELSVLRIGTTSITFRYLVHRAGAPAQPRQLCAEGSVVCAVVDLSRFMAVAVPEHVTQLLADLVATEPPAPG